MIIPFRTTPKTVWAEGIQIREGTPDRDCVAEQHREYGHISWKGKTVTDLGANIGSFSWFALVNGAARVRCVEPEAENFEMLKLNMASFGGDLHHAAVTPYGETARLSIKTTWSHTTADGGSDNVVVVPGISLADSLLPVDGHPVDILKCDIEGAEFELPWEESLLGSDLEMVVMEAHLTRKKWRFEQFPELLQQFHRAGFTVDDATIPKKAWHVVRTWWR